MNIYKDDAPIHIASENGHLPIVEYLLSKGANIEVKEKLLGRTPLHYAVDIEAKDISNLTPLHFATYYFSKTDIVKYLVSKGANKNAKDRHDKTPYDLAWKNEIRNILK